jgi:hypothetical protein
MGCGMEVKMAHNTAQPHTKQRTVSTNVMLEPRTLRVMQVEQCSLNPTAMNHTTVPHNLCTQHATTHSVWPHSPARTVETFLLVSTRPTARPSGMLCTARDSAMNWPVCMPLLPPKDTPMPVHCK